MARIRELLKGKLKTLAQYFCIALVAGLINFFVHMLPHPRINLDEAWLNYEPLLRDWLIIFVAISVLRLLIVLLLKR